METKRDKSPGDSSEQQLRQLLHSNGCIVYHRDLPDPEYPWVKCSIYGAPKTNELFVRLASGTVEFVGVVASPVTFPVMADRILGLDAADFAVAFELADRLWEKHRIELVGVNARRRPR